PHRLGRHIAVGDRIELALELEIVVEPHALEDLDELVHAPVARLPAGEELAEHLELLRARAIDDVDAEPPTADAVDRGRVLGDDLGIDDARMHRRHDLDRARLRSERRRQHPGIEIRAEEALRDERDLEAELLRPAQHVDRIEIVPVDAAAVAGPRVERRLAPRIPPDGERGRTPDAESHAYVSWVYAQSPLAA